MISQYLEERAKWKKFGKPIRSQEEMEQLFIICNDCEAYKKSSDESGSCQICGCNIKKTSHFLNKIAWGTTKCPLPEPKWEESDVRYKKEMYINIAELNQAEKDHKKDLAKELESNKPRGCGC